MCLNAPPAPCRSGPVCGGRGPGREAGLWPPEPTADQSDPPGGKDEGKAAQIRSVRQYARKPFTQALINSCFGDSSALIGPSFGHRTKRGHVRLIYCHTLALPPGFRERRSKRILINEMLLTCMLRFHWCSRCSRQRSKGSNLFSKGHRGDCEAALQRHRT